MYGIAYIFGDADSDMINLSLGQELKAKSNIFQREFTNKYIAMGYCLAMHDNKIKWLESAKKEGKGYLAVCETSNPFKVLCIVEPAGSDSTLTNKLGISEKYE